MTRQLVAVAAAATIAWGCTPPEPTRGDRDPVDTDVPDTDLPPDTDTDTDTGATTTTTGSTGDTGGSTPGIVVDCAALSPVPISSRIVPGARSHHSIAFDAYGMLLGWDNSNVMAYDFYGNGMVYSPNIG